MATFDRGTFCVYTLAVCGIKVLEYHTSNELIYLY